MTIQLLNNYFVQVALIDVNVADEAQQAFVFNLEEESAEAIDTYIIQRLIYHQPHNVLIQNQVI